MTVHRQKPSEVEPEEIGELIADCMALPDLALPQPRATAPEHEPVQLPGIQIPEQTASLVAEYADYGS